ncbi:uncharacterized protein LOC110608637 isoform X1 [Manihot esculenta]|uniref:IST1-like protein n=2 Tax=Manihot esculenta TaxID=3983 RepID=A0A2C9WBL9_MANES|nr:uncharacterized protein LOC110608637 isoform X1 [Manihot esculenta]OAY57064.1 hypothetical protein MANES_02G067700v8 [Manihot esculenta]
MGKKLKAFLGKTFKTSKFRILTKIAISRIAYLEKQHKVRYSQARADVLELLNIGQRERALLRAEHVIREQNVLDAYAMIENYFHLLMERVVILEKNKKCPEELKEAISSLIFAASRCGELPELQKIRKLFASRFGKEFATCAVELRNNCGVNPKIVKKLATRQPSLDSKLKALNEINPANEINLQAEGSASTVTEEKLEKQPEYIESGESSADPQLHDDMRDFPVKQQQDENFSETAKVREKYKDTEAAAEAAFQFASQAAAAARAAVKLSKTQDGNSDESQNSSNHERYPFHFDESLLISELRVDGKAATKEKNQKKEVELERGVVRNDDEAKKKQINETVALKHYSGEKSILRTKSDTDGDLSNENKDEFTCKPPNDNLLIQADSTKGKSELEGAQQKDSVEEMATRVSKAGRRPFSMRTRRVDRN